MTIRGFCPGRTAIRSGHPVVIGGHQFGNVNRWISPPAEEQLIIDQREVRKIREAGGYGPRARLGQQGNAPRQQAGRPK
jgi:hypothetical protein